MSDKGFIDWMPRGEDVKHRISIIQQILEEYRDHVPLTMRQIFYRAVGMFDYEKTERAYERLLYSSCKARRAGIISFRVIRDDGVTIRQAGGYSNLTDLQDRMIGAAENYRRERLSGQGRRLIILCETAGMVPQIVRVAHPYGVDVQSSGGYDSLTAKFDLASDIIQHDMPTTILHLGDLDPSGEDIFKNIQEDVGAFVGEMAVEDHGDHGQWIVSQATLNTIRIAVTREQVRDLALPSAPPKASDSRTKNFEGETVQCEAIPPDILAEIVTEAIESRIDMDIYNSTLLKKTKSGNGQSRSFRILIGEYRYRQRDNLFLLTANNCSNFVNYLL